MYTCENVSETTYSVYIYLGEGLNTFKKNIKYAIFGKWVYVITDTTRKEHALN